MGRIRQSLCWWCFRRGDLTPEQLFREAKRIGYESVEMLPREHWDACREAGLRIAITGGHGTLTNGLNKRGNHNRIEDEICRNLELAEQYEIPGLICFSGNREGISDEEGLYICAEGLERVIGAAEEKGINLCVELLNSKVDHPDYQCDHTAWGVELCQRVGSDRCKLLYDIYHMQIMEGDLIRTVTQNIRYIGHFHTAGNPGRRDMDDQQEIYYPALMRAIKATDYDLFIGHEFSPKGDPIAAAQAAFDLCNV